MKATGIIRRIDDLVGYAVCDQQDKGCEMDMIVRYLSIVSER